MDSNDCQVPSYEQSRSFSIKNDNSLKNRQEVTLVACGSFNPITNMHLRMFELARDYLHRHQSQYVVTEGIISPVSDGYGKHELVSACHRKQMCELAVSNNKWIKVMDWELKKEDWTPTAKVLDHFHEVVNKNKSLNKRVMLLCGADLLKSFLVKDLWLEKDIRTIIEGHGLLVVTRSPYSPSEIINQSDLLFELQNQIFVIPEWIANNISSTKVRQAVRRKQSIKYLIPDPVIDYIYDHKLYYALQSSVEEELAPLKRRKMSPSVHKSHV